MLSEIVCLVVCIMCILCITRWRKQSVSARPRQTVSVSAAYIINMKENTNRLALFEKRYDESDLTSIPKIVVEAVNGRELEPQYSKYVDQNVMEDLIEVVRTGKRRYHAQLTPGAVGCYLSHMKILKESRQKNILIFEDDAKIPSKIRDNLDTLMDCVRKRDPNWDIILLGFISDDINKATVCIKVGRFYQTHAYVVRNPMTLYRKITTEIPKMKQQIDSDLSDLSEKNLIKIYGYGPGNMIEQSYESGTDIQTPFFES